MVTDLVYIDCPKCKRRIREPFAPGTVTVWTHWGRGATGSGCRILIAIAEDGSEYGAWVVPDRMSYEDALRYARQGDEIGRAA